MSLFEAINEYSPNTRGGIPTFEKEIDKIDEKLFPYNKTSKDLGEDWEFNKQTTVTKKPAPFIITAQDSYLLVECKSAEFIPFQEEYQISSIVDFKKNIREQINEIFKNAKIENFEDGMDSEFSKKLVSLIKNYENNSIEILSDMIMNENVTVDIASEALRWIGRIKHEETHDARFDLLIKSLTHSSPFIRDGAIIGLDLMEDPKAVPYLIESIKNEKLTLIRKDMLQVLENLENL